MRQALPGTASSTFLIRHAPYPPSETETFISARKGAWMAHVWCFSATFHSRMAIGRRMMDSILGRGSLIPLMVRAPTCFGMDAVRGKRARGAFSRINMRCYWIELELRRSGERSRRKWQRQLRCGVLILSR
jgi:hypothetical protein